MVEIIPAILTDSDVKFKDLILRIEPYASRVHVDVTDGDFVPNKTIAGYVEIMDVETALKFDVHLMVREPAKHLKEWLYTHADRFIIHAESEGEPIKIADELHNNNRKVGLCFNPETDISGFEDIIQNFDFVQFMTVHPGFQGGQFVKEIVDKIKSFHQKYPDIMIMCDGGITPETAPTLAEAGATALVSGSYVVKSDDVGKAIKQLRSSL